MKVSIVIPTYNEVHDIADTLDSLVALDYPDKEIIVVDDSTDETPRIVGQYESRGVRLIRPEKRGGRCEARNRGVLEANGDIVVHLNADVRLPSDFIQRILPHYRNGYDYVLVNAAVSNMDDLLARYVECVCLQYYDNVNVDSSEGFSTRRDIAIKAGLFPTGYPVHIVAGDDATFGERLRKIGAKKMIDHSIVVPHVAPAAFDEYWHIRKGRGKGSPQVRVYVQGWSILRTTVWALLRLVKTTVFVGTVVPMAIELARITRHSPRGWLDFLPFLWAWLVEQAAFHFGEFESIAEIARRRAATEKDRSPASR